MGHVVRGARVRRERVREALAVYHDLLLLATPPKGEPAYRGVRSAGVMRSRSARVMRSRAIRRVLRVGFSDALRVGAHIGDSHGDGGERRAEDGWEAEQWCLHVERRQRRTCRDQLVNSRHSLQQSLQGRLTLEHDRADAFFDERRVADELERVAQALLGVYENRLFRQR